MSKKTRIEIGPLAISGTKEEIMFMIEDMTKIVREMTAEDLESAMRRSDQKLKEKK